MSNTNDTNSTLVAVLSTTALAYTGYHAYKFDQFRCLVPRKKDWFRVLLTWQLVMSSISMLTFSGGWAYIKYQLGWTYLPTYGTIPYPTSLYTEQYKKLNTPFTFWLCVSYSLQVSLNAEEGLYWYHLMRAVQRRKSAKKGWFNSRFFLAWIAISLITPISLVCAGWAGYRNMDTQMARMGVVGGAIELAVVLSAAAVLLRFPDFLKDVKTSGAGPKVRARLHFYHEANKIRTFFRIIFTICILVLGIDGLTDEKRINMNQLIADLLNQTSYLAFFFATIVSVTVSLIDTPSPPSPLRTSHNAERSRQSSRIPSLCVASLTGHKLYLPRNWGSSPPSSGQVMVAQPPVSRRGQGGGGGGVEQNQITSQASQALISLLRQGGQWDADDDLLAGLMTFGVNEHLVDDGNFGDVGDVGDGGGIGGVGRVGGVGGSRASRGSEYELDKRKEAWEIEVEGDVDGDTERQYRPSGISALEDWTAPFVFAPPIPKRPLS